VKIFVVDRYYPRFLTAYYRAHPQVRQESYVEQKRHLMATCFGTSDFYSRNLRQLGHEADEVVWNAEPLQRAWAAESGNRALRATYGLRGRRWRGVPVPTIGISAQWYDLVLLAQIAAVQPDVLYVQDAGWLSTFVLSEARPLVRLIAAQHASPIVGTGAKGFDVVISSLPNLVERFRADGLKSEYLPLAFESSILHRARGTSGDHYDTVFIGSFTPAHAAGTRFLDEVAAKTPVDFWGHGDFGLREAPSVRRRFHGEAWGLDMYRVLGSAKIGLNRHIDVAAIYSNNMRLYETTGMGALLITDARTNLGQLFRVGTEVVSYTTAGECAELVRHFLERDAERRQIAHAGQERTLREHSYRTRMEQLVELLGRYL
jgi:spore maturation protein CgeB